MVQNSNGEERLGLPADLRPGIKSRLELSPVRLS